MLRIRFFAFRTVLQSARTMMEFAPVVAVAAASPQSG